MRWGNAVVVHRFMQRSLMNTTLDEQQSLISLLPVFHTASSSHPTPWVGHLQGDNVSLQTARASEKVGRKNGWYSQMCRPAGSRFFASVTPVLCYLVHAIHIHPNSIQSHSTPLMRRTRRHAAQTLQHNTVPKMQKPATAFPLPPSDSVHRVPTLVYKSSGYSSSGS